MLCEDVRRVVYFFLDDSLSSRKRQDIEIHLSDCHGCETRISIQRRLRSFLRSRLSPQPAPEHLRIRVSQSIRSAVAE
jgi:mycothiol system anti-sigma-R factor